MQLLSGCFNLKRYILLIIFFVSTLCGDSPFNIKERDSIAKFEVKIIVKIAKDIINKDLKIFSVGVSKEFIELIPKDNLIGDDCKKANFIYVASSSIEELKNCSNEDALYFTNDRELFEKDKRFIGLFYWFKSRPNIVFSAKRLYYYQLILPDVYKRFVEEF